MLDMGFQVKISFLSSEEFSFFFVEDDVDYIIRNISRSQMIVFFCNKTIYRQYY
jgi:hypothetical protein